jgi:hypothetical protein
MAKAMGKRGASQLLPGNGGETTGRGWSTSAGGIGFGGVAVMLTPLSPAKRTACDAQRSVAAILQMLLPTCKEEMIAYPLLQDARNSCEFRYTAAACKGW